MQCIGAAWLEMRGNIVQITFYLPPFMTDLELLIMGCKNIFLMKAKETWNLMIPFIDSREYPFPILHACIE